MRINKNNQINKKKQVNKNKQVNKKKQVRNKIINKIILITDNILLLLIV